MQRLFSKILRLQGIFLATLMLISGGFFCQPASAAADLQTRLNTATEWLNSQPNVELANITIPAGTQIVNDIPLTINSLAKKFAVTLPTNPTEDLIFQFDSLKFSELETLIGNNQLSEFLPENVDPNIQQLLADLENLAVSQLELRFAGQELALKEISGNIPIDLQNAAAVLSSINTLDLTDIGLFFKINDPIGVAEIDDSTKLTALLPIGEKVANVYLQRQLSDNTTNPEEETSGEKSWVVGIEANEDSTLADVKILLEKHGQNIGIDALILLINRAKIGDLANFSVEGVEIWFDSEDNLKNLKIRTDFDINMSEFSFSGANLPLNLHVADFIFSLVGKSEFSATLTLSGYADSMNSSMAFNVLVDNFVTKVTFNQEDQVAFKMLTSPLRVLTVDEATGEANIDLGVDLGQIGKIFLTLPTITYDFTQSTFSAEGDLRFEDVSLSLDYILGLLNGTHYEYLADFVPSELRNINLADVDMGQIAFPRAQQSNLPSNFEPYRHMDIPNELTYQFSVNTAKRAMAVGFKNFKFASDPNKKIFSLGVPVNVGFAGLQVEEFHIGNTFNYITLSATGRLDIFDTPQVTIHSYLGVSEPEASLDVDKLFLVFPPGSPVPVGMFYNQISAVLQGIDGLRTEVVTQFPEPTFTDNLFKSVTSDYELTASDIAEIVPRFYLDASLTLPSYLGGKEIISMGHNIDFEPGTQSYLKIFGEEIPTNASEYASNVASLYNALKRPTGKNILGAIPQEVRFFEIDPIYLGMPFQILLSGNNKLAMGIGSLTEFRSRGFSSAALELLQFPENERSEDNTIGLLGGIDNGLEALSLGIGENKGALATGLAIRSGRSNLLGISLTGTGKTYLDTSDPGFGIQGNFKLDLLGQGAVTDGTVTVTNNGLSFAGELGLANLVQGNVSGTLSQDILVLSGGVDAGILGSMQATIGNDKFELTGDLVGQSLTLTAKPAGTIEGEINFGIKPPLPNIEGLSDTTSLSVPIKVSASISDASFSVKTVAVSKCLAGLASVKLGSIELGTADLASIPNLTNKLISGVVTEVSSCEDNFLGDILNGAWALKKTMLGEIGGQAAEVGQEVISEALSMANGDFSKMDTAYKLNQLSSAASSLGSSSLNAANDGLRSLSGGINDIGSGVGDFVVNFQSSIPDLDDLASIASSVQDTVESITNSVQDFFDSLF